MHTTTRPDASIPDRIETLLRNNPHYWGSRIAHELELAHILTARVPDAAAYSELIDKALTRLEQDAEEAGTVTKQAVTAAEATLSPLSPHMKRYRIVCASHAHIDMNWLWGFAETVSVTLDTFRTILRLMDEYPDFTFSQSQASVYEIVENHDPSLLAEIKRRVAEGRWEVTASHWVEPDKNMPNGESLTRHLLYTRRYLSQLLDIAPERLNLDFVPDTFGHNLNVPEILSDGGIQYLYHCRGHIAGEVYYYQSPSGRRVLCYCEQDWYNSTIRPDFLKTGLSFALHKNIHTALKVYGVGDHGGGPTRRDVERLLDMRGWPLAPEVCFGTFGEFFAAMEAEYPNAPVVTQERNFLFDGCYTTQSRIKAANRVGELRLNQAEALGVMAALAAGTPYDNVAYENAWRKLLFNHFHDILPGSGVISTRECALGYFNDILAFANSRVSQAADAITRRIDTARLLPAEEPGEDIAEGAGAGFNITDFTLPATERGRGKTRLFHVFNPTGYARTEAALITLWDWPYDINRLSVTDPDGNALPAQAINDRRVSAPQDRIGYWGHDYIKVWTEVTCPAYGYATVAVTERPRTEPFIRVAQDLRLDTPIAPVMENDMARVVFNPADLSVVSFTDKQTHTELIDQTQQGAGLRFVMEDAVRGMTAWTVGRTMTDTPAFERVTLRGISNGPVCTRLQFTGYLRASKVDGIITLRRDRLEYLLTVDWFEKGTEDGIPQLNFTVPLAYSSTEMVCDIAYGVVTRTAADRDVPALSFTYAPNTQDKTRPSLMLATKTKYGFRLQNNRLSVDLIRSAIDPDPYPEIGVQQIEFALQPVRDAAPSALLKQAQGYTHPMLVMPPYGKPNPQADLPLTGGFVTAEGGCAVSSVKLAEPVCNDGLPDGDGNNAATHAVIVRLYETDGRNADISLSFARPVKHACLVDANEIERDEPVTLTDGQVRFTLGAYAVCAVKAVLLP